MKTYNHLWEQFISEENIKLAIKNVCLHKTKRPRFKHLKENPDKYIDWIRREVEDFHNDEHTPIEIYDGIQRKKRIIIVPTFREQIIHHMVVNILKPIIMKSLIFHTYGSIPGRGSHLAKKKIAKAIRKDTDIKYCLKMDIKKYFSSIPHDKLKELYSNKIKDKKFLALLYEITDVNSKGLPLGFYTSQWISNWYLSNLDHFIKERLHAKHYYRYMDDMVILGHSKTNLHLIRLIICAELAFIGLYMKHNWQVFEFDYAINGRHYGRDLDFMGFRFFIDRISIRRNIYYKICRKARRLHKKESITVHDARQMLSYNGWFKHTDSFRVYTDNILPFVSMRRLKKIVSINDKKKGA